MSEPTITNHDQSSCDETIIFFKGKVFYDKNAEGYTPLPLTKDFAMVDADNFDEFWQAASGRNSTKHLAKLINQVIAEERETAGADLSEAWIVTNVTAVRRTECSGQRVVNLYINWKAIVAEEPC